MRLYNWNDFKGGWYIGRFDPTIIPSDEVEVCIKRYKAGDHDQSHKHILADEITMIIEGFVDMNKVKYRANDIIWIEKGEVTDFTALTDAVTCVVKLPCVKGDKYLV